MTTDLDMRGRDAATSLRQLVATSVDAQALTDAYEIAIGRQRRHVAIQERPQRTRRPRLIALVAIAAAVILAIVVITRNDDDKSPIEPTPGPTTSAPPASTAVPTTTTEPRPDRGSTSLASIGPDLGFGPYPPDVISLPDGRVLKIAGSFGDPNTLDVLDPSTGEVTTIGTTLVARSGPAMVLLDNGRVLIAGGDMGPKVTSADGSSTTSSPAEVNSGEVFDLTTGTSLSAGPMVAPRYFPLGARLPDGTVIVIGNFANEQGLVESPPELYDPRTNSFRRTGDRTTTEQPVELFPMDDGRLLVFGTHSEIYDPATETFTATGGTTAERPTSAVMLQDGTVLSIQGYCSEVHTLDADGLSEGHPPVHTERFDPRTGSFTPGPDLPHCVTTAATLPSGEVFLAGYWWSATAADPANPSGSDAQRTWSGVLDPATGVTMITPNPNRRNAQALVTSDGRLLLVAGVGVGDRFTWADIYP